MMAEAEQYAEENYNRRGYVDLTSDNHEMWRLVQNRVEQRQSWEDIAREIGCSVEEILHWANWVYQPPKKPVAKVNPAKIERTSVSDMPMRTPTDDARRFLAWKKAQEGARKAREAMQA